MYAVLDLGIDLNVWPWIWLVTAVVFALVELVALGGSFLVLPWAGSAFIAAMLAFYDVSIEIQWLVFVFGGALLFALLYRWAQGFMKAHENDPGVGADRLIGLHAVVTGRIAVSDPDRVGRVNIDGDNWRATTDLATSIEPGTKVVVRSVRGTRVVVEPITETSQQQGDTQKGE